MAGFIERVEKSYFENLEKDLCSTCEGSAFMARYAVARSTVSDLESKVISVIRDSNFSTEEAIGFMQYMKHAIMHRSSVPQSKGHE